ncbi:uncharacterized protein [Diabrotica undecimpunctata]|uniref:uncharacterized protein n=1 Tax=Diabrotica undecimpunctata TaxID=50387 RepID=UPI003B6416D2
MGRNFIGNLRKLYRRKRQYLDEGIEVNKATIHKSWETKGRSDRQPTTSRAFIETNGKACHICGSYHSLYQCQKFKELSLQLRRDEVRKANVCWNCLRIGHRVQNCTSGGCRSCGKRHHTLLHSDINNKVENTQIHNQIGQNTRIIQGTSTHRLHMGGSGIQNNTGTQNQKAFTSQAIHGQNSYEQAVNQSSSDQGFQLDDTTLGLDTTPTDNQTIGQGFQLDSFKSTQMVEEVQEQVLLSTAIIHMVDNIGNMHKCRALLDSGSQSNFITRSLAEKLQLTGQKINIPVVGIGQGITNIKRSVKATIHSRFEGQVVLGKNQPLMQKTKLGWIISGKIFPYKKQYNKQDFLVNCHFLSEVTLENKIEKFWDIEEIPQKRFLSKEDKFCEETFQNTTFRNKNGSFTVTLPERSTVMPLGKSFSMALRRFHTLERKLARDSELRRQYEVFMEEYI